MLKNLGMPCEGVFFEEIFEKLVQVENFAEQRTPKIRLDSGKIVYGFQVWWATVCEKCGSSDMGKLFSGFSVGHGSNPVSQDNSSCPTGTCPLSQ